MPEYMLSDEQMRHIQQILDKHYVLNAEPQAALHTQVELVARLMAVLAHVRAHPVTAVAP